MKTIILSIFLLSFSTNVFSQKKVVKQFGHAIELYDSKIYDSSFIIFQQIYRKGRGDLSLISKAYYNMGYILLITKDYANAKMIFEDILTSDFDDMDEGGTGEGLMAEPYALYKNNSCNILAKLALEEKDFKKALAYTEMADKEYPYYHFCGNEYAANNIHLAWLYAKCYEGLGDKDKALTTLLPECLDNGLANNDSIVKMAAQLIKEKYKYEEIEAAIDNAVAGISSRKVRIGTNSRTQYITSLFQFEMTLPGSYYYGSDYRKAKDLDELGRYTYNFRNSTFIAALLNN